MNPRKFFEGGVAGESYWEGVSRRTRLMCVALFSVLASGGIAYATNRISHSIILTLGVALVCGFVSGAGYLRLIPASATPARRAEKLFWLVWFAPVFVILAAGIVYTASEQKNGADVVGAFSMAWLLGSLTFATSKVLTWGRAAQ